MPDSIITQLFDFGALGIFAGFLVWQHLRMQKRLDRLVAEFQNQIKEIDTAYDARIDTIRARYDDLLARGAVEEVDDLRDEIEDALTEIRNQMSFLVRVTLGGKEE